MTILAVSPNKSLVLHLAAQGAGFPHHFQQQEGFLLFDAKVGEDGRKEVVDFLLAGNLESQDVVVSQLAGSSLIDRAPETILDCFHDGSGGGCLRDQCAESTSLLGNDDRPLAIKEASNPCDESNLVSVHNEKSYYVAALPRLGSRSLPWSP